VQFESGHLKFPSSVLILFLTQVYSKINTANSAMWSTAYSISDLFPDAETVPDYTGRTLQQLEHYANTNINIVTSSRNQTSPSKLQN
jgi:S-adenosylhomocysteine hydrolase